MSKIKVFRLSTLMNKKGEFIRPKKIDDFDHPLKAEEKIKTLIKKYPEMMLKLKNCWTDELWAYSSENLETRFPNHDKNKEWDWNKTNGKN